LFLRKVSRKRDGKPREKCKNLHQENVQSTNSVTSTQKEVSKHLETSGKSIEQIVPAVTQKEGADFNKFERSENLKNKSRSEKKPVDLFTLQPRSSLDN
jgi:hypothetical protein